MQDQLAQSSKSWWLEVSRDEEKLEKWLKAQYVGEVTAVDRLRGLKEFPGITEEHLYYLNKIIADESRHAEWIKELMLCRGIDLPKIEDHHDRYWTQSSSGVLKTLDAFAVAAHAEEMRLVRIQTIVDDASEEAPQDVREIFSRILPDEKFHASAFKKLAGSEAFEAMRPYHEKGMQVLGLVD